MLSPTWPPPVRCCWIELVCLPVISASRMLIVMLTHHRWYACREPIVRMLMILSSSTFPLIVCIKLYVYRFSQFQRCFLQYACREPIVKMLSAACQAYGGMFTGLLSFNGCWLIYVCRANFGHPSNCNDILFPSQRCMTLITGDLLYDCLLQSICVVLGIWNNDLEPRDYFNKARNNT